MRRTTAYIHQRPDWPRFTWDGEALAAALAGVRHKQGRRLGKMEALGFDLRAEASLAVLTNDVVKSSAIEGEVLNPEEVRSSSGRRYGSLVTVKSSIPFADVLNPPARMK